MNSAPNTHAPERSRHHTGPRGMTSAARSLAEPLQFSSDVTIHAARLRAVSPAEHCLDTAVITKAAEAAGTQTASPGIAASEAACTGVAARHAKPPRTAEEELQVLATWEVVAAAQCGDAEAFGLLYDRYVDMVFRYVLFRVNDRSLAEDLTSETFLRALRRITSITYQGKDVGAWFVTIARNIVLDHVKSSRHRLEFSTAEILDFDSTEDPEAEVITASVVAELFDCVRQLGNDQRECIALRFLQGLSVAETAAAMGRNEGAVKALQHRAIRRLGTLMPATLR
ncbi:MAG: sigma-70 family RNA polymerase sigma factor [Mycobacteriaceae bacterium]